MDTALAEEIAATDKKGRATKWKCTAECKPVTPEEIENILELKPLLQLSIPSLRRALDNLDGGCSYTPQ